MSELQEWAGRARRAQGAVNELGAGPPLRFHGTGLAATLTLELAVVRSATSRRCSRCKRKRALYALTMTGAPVGNPEPIWLCAPDAGLRPAGRRDRVPDVP